VFGGDNNPLMSHADAFVPSHQVAQASLSRQWPPLLDLSTVGAFVLGKPRQKGWDAFQQLTQGKKDNRL